MRKLKIPAILAAFLLLCGLLTAPASAARSTAYTYTISVDGEYIRTQDAYIPSRIYLNECGLSGPQDVFVHGKQLYVADTGNARVLIYDMETDTYRELKHPEFVKPMGLFVDDDGELYVADAEAQAVFVFRADGTLRQKIGRPDSVLFGSQSAFNPKNVAVSSQKNLFVVGLGTYEGIMQFDADGEFQGYFAANKRSLTAFERLQQLVLNEEQLNSLSDKIPNAIYNMDINGMDLLYSVTQSGSGSSSNVTTEEKTENSLKLHNMAGTNILSVNRFMDDEWNFVDVAAGKNDTCVAVTQTGLIYEYDGDGNLLFSFGGRSVGNDSYGLISVAAAIDMNDEGILFVLDSERGILQTFTPTDFTTLTHQALYLMNGGKYAQAEQAWQEILKLNGMSKIAHVGYGRTLMRQQQYAAALEHFRFSNDREDYSECFWELRDSWISSHMVWILAGAALLIAALVCWNRFFRKKKLHGSTMDLRENTATGAGRLGADLRFSFSMLAHPIDGFYYLKRGIFGSVASASVLYGLALAVFVIENTCQAFIFNGNPVPQSVSVLFILFLVCAVFWVVGNYMVSTINDGEGSLRDLYVLTAYALTPYLLITPIKVILTYGFTQNEAFFIHLMTYIAILWSAVILYMGLMHMHNYTFLETLKNIILTLFIMVIALAAIAIVYLIWMQLAQFLTEFFTEVKYVV